MAEIHSILDRMDQTNSDILTAVRRTDAKRNMDVLALRDKFARDTGNLLRELETDPALVQRPELAGEMADRLFGVRQQLAAHQAKWRMVNVEEQHDVYLIACTQVNAVISDYIRWAKSALAGT